MTVGVTSEGCGNWIGRGKTTYGRGVLHVNVDLTYLRYALQDKSITSQRAGVDLEIISALERFWMGGKDRIRHTIPMPAH